MKIIDIKFENCYGIKSFAAQFDFSSCKAHSIYAPNGSMKTSFSKTFEDYSKGKETRDLIFNERANLRVLTDENKNNISPESIFVIEPYNKDFSSEKTSMLLVNPEIKREYDAALVKIDEKKDEVMKELKQLSGLTGRNITPETEIPKIFKSKSIFEILEKPPVYSSLIPIETLGTLVYANIFNDKTIAFLNNADVKKQIVEYIKEYDALVTHSPILNKKFNHIQAQNIHKDLTNSGFFDAKHSVNLFNGEKREEYISSQELEKKILSEKQKIFSDKSLEKKFDAIDRKLSNAELRALRDYLYDNQEILVELNDLPSLQKNLFVAYFKKIEGTLKQLTSIYQETKKTIEFAITRAKGEHTAWENVIDIFKKRFCVPFDVTIKNQEDVILKESSPQLKFEFIDGEEKKEVENNSLLEILSQGEKRALYLMNILFEINARIKQNIETILIIDDIADSFDYKNKYAIIEYLREITMLPIFSTIFLTHNFDFHRTISSRLNIKRECRHFVYRNDGNLQLQKELYQKNPFECWKEKLTEPKYFISSIPFVRNLAEYCGDLNVFNLLTSALHVKKNTDALTIEEIENAFKIMLKDKSTLNMPNKNGLYVDLLNRLAQLILSEPNESTELESKIILSMAIRYLAEKYMIREISDASFVNGITKNQTLELFKKYSDLYSSKKTELGLLEEVNIMTPENIHLNSFMYEPILDMSPVNLKRLYSDIKIKLA
ncbi:MAG: hypothetical protein M0P13_09690 [Fibrobacteraceae bacterium]|nr:hypothetical protein [Fibrobacteraceae bacterium]